MFINNYCTDFMFQEVMVCVTYSSSILSLIIFNFLLVFKIYSVLLSVSCPKALYHLESDNLFRITVVVADWLG